MAMRQPVWVGDRDNIWHWRRWQWTSNGAGWFVAKHDSHCQVDVRTCAIRYDTPPKGDLVCHKCRAAFTKRMLIGNIDNRGRYIARVMG